MSLAHYEGLFVPGLDQWVTIQSRNAANPVLFILSGPGAAFSRMAPFFAPWEADFTLVQWDQPGAGATVARNGAQPLSLDRLARDAASVLEFVLYRLARTKALVLGISGGSVVGLMLARQRPDLLSAYIGTGQFVDWATQDRLSYDLLLARARAAGDQAIVGDLVRIGPPPYADAETDLIKSGYAGAMTAAELAAFAGLDAATSAAMANPPSGATYVAPGLPAPDQRANAMAAYQAVRAELLTFDARALGMRFDIPMVFLQGDEDVYSVTSEVDAYAAQIQAPVVRFALVAGGGHSSVFMRDAFLDLLNRHVRPLT